MTSLDEFEGGDDTPSTRPGGPPSEPLERDTLESELRARPGASGDASSVGPDVGEQVDDAPKRLARTARSVESPLRQGTPNASTTQESVAIDPSEIDRSLLAERRIVVLEDEVSQLNARVRLAEKSVEETRRLAMASALFTLVALIVLKWFFR